MPERRETQQPPVHLVTRQDGIRKEFADLRGAVSFISSYSIDNWHLLSPLETPLQGELIDIDGVESLRLSIGSRVGIVPRSISGVQEGVGVSTDRKNFFNLVVHVDEWESRVFDRGLAWVQITEANFALLLMHILKEHGLSSDELFDKVKEVFPKIFAFVNGILDSNPFPPFSQGGPITRIE